MLKHTCNAILKGTIRPAACTLIELRGLQSWEVGKYIDFDDLNDKFAHREYCCFGYRLI